MEELLKREANYCGDRGLYINIKGQLIDPLQGCEVRGVGEPRVDDANRFFNILNEDQE